MDKRLKIAVSGAAALTPCAKGATKRAEEIGKEIVNNDCILISGATTGIPDYSAKAVKDAKGISIGFSPAASEVAHLKKYRLPVNSYDVIVYTGFGYAGRNLLMTRAADGVIVICGRMGTLNEFTIAFEDEKPIGVLLGTGGTADKIKVLLKSPFRGKKKIVYDEDPKKLVKKLIGLIKKEKKKNGE